MTLPADDDPVTKPIEITIRTIDGEPLIDTAGIALLFGIDPARVRKFMALNFRDNQLAFPPDWMRAGRRRSSEAAAATGSRDVLDVMAYWARRDHDADLVIVNQDAHRDLGGTA